MSELLFDPLIIRSNLALIFIMVIYAVLMALFFMRHIGDLWIHNRWKLFASFVVVILSINALVIEQVVSGINPFSIFAFIMITSIVMVNFVFFDSFMNFVLFIAITLFRSLLLLNHPLNLVFISHLKYIVLFLGSSFAYYRVYRLRHRYYFVFLIGLFLLLVEVPIVYDSEPWLYPHIFIFSVLMFLITQLYMTVVQRYQTYYEYAHKDFLTDLYNDRALSNQMRLLSIHDYSNFCYVFIDFNGLKRINDTYGHVYGDASLVLVANKLKECFGKKAIIFRKSGDEFVVLIEGPIESVRQKSETLLSELKEQSIHTRLGEISPKVAIGIVLIQRQMNEREIFDLADRAMYQAKEFMTPVVVE